MALEQTHIQLLRTDRETIAWFSGKRWNPNGLYSKSRLIRSHRLFQYPRIFDAIKRCETWIKAKVFNALCRLRWLEDDFTPETRLNITTINLDNLTKVIADHQGWLSLIERGHAKYLIIGRDEWNWLLNQRDWKMENMISFAIPDTYRARIAKDGERLPYFFRGLQVVVVPWIDGMFLLPELEK